MSENETIYVPAKTIAAKYSISETMIIRLAREGEIPALRVGGVWRFDPEAVHAEFTKPRPFARKLQKRSKIK